MMRQTTKAHHHTWRIVHYGIICCITIKVPQFETDYVINIYEGLIGGVGIEFYYFRKKSRITYFLVFRSSSSLQQIETQDCIKDILIGTE